MTNTVLRFKKKDGFGVFVQVNKDLDVKLFTDEHHLVLERLKAEGSTNRVSRDMKKLKTNEVQNLGWVSVYSSQSADKTSDLLLDLGNKYNKSVPALITQLISNAEDESEWEHVMQTFLNYFAQTYLGFLLPSFGVTDYVTYVYRQNSAELRNNRLVAGYRPEKIQDALLDSDYGLEPEDIANFTVGIIGLDVHTESAYRTTSAKLLLYIFQPEDESKGVTLVPVVRFGEHIVAFVESTGVGAVTNSNDLPERILGICTSIDQAYEVMKRFAQDLQDMFFVTIFPYFGEEEEEEEE